MQSEDGPYSFCDYNAPGSGDSDRRISDLIVNSVTVTMFVNPDFTSNADAFRVSGNSNLMRWRKFGFVYLQPGNQKLTP